MDAETREEFRKLNEKIDERFDNLENKIDHGFSQLLPEEQWPPSEHDLQKAEIRRKL